MQLLTNCRIATMAPGAAYGLIDDAAVLVADGAIAWAGPRAEAPRAGAIDCGGRLITPGLIDCHTHIVYGGDRANEFEMRLNGAAYAEIAKAGGGIAATVRATRAASEDALFASARRRLQSLLAEGVTTIEIKSGYGLDVETELKMLRVARRLGEAEPVNAVTSFLGAHTFPPEYKDRHGDYVKLVCEEALPAAAREGLADAVDAFCEGIAFSVAETETVFKAAKALGLPVKLHAEQLGNLGGAAIAAAGTVAVLLPGAFYYLREKQAPPVAALRAHGVTIAVATDLNPGSSPVHSLLSAMNMACVLFGLTPEEALKGVTVNAARALGLEDRGVIAPGMRADLAVWDVARPGDLPYPLGFNPCAAVMRSGEWIRGDLGS